MREALAKRLIEGVLFAAFMLLAAASLYRPMESVMTLWLGNGVLAALLIMLSTRREVAAVTVAAFVAHLIIALTVGARPLERALLGTIATVGEAALVALATRRYLGSSADFTRLAVLLRFVFVCTAPPVALVLGVVLAIRHTYVPFDFLPYWGTAALGDALGVVMSAPALLIILRGQDNGLFKRSIIERCLLLTLLAGVELVLFRYSASVAIFLVYPLLTAISFRLGPVGAAYGVTVTGLISFTSASFGSGGSMFAGDSPFIGSILPEIFFLAVICTALPAAGAVAAQARLRIQLVAREAEARSAAAAKSDFLATMSHELRTPLNGISGYSQLLAAQDDLPAEARRRVELIEDASHALLTVVNDILDYSKAEAGRIELSPRPFNLEAWASSSMHIVREQAERKHLRLERTIAPEAQRWFSADDARLRQVLLNLLNNAIKFTSEGSVSLTISVVDLAETSARLRFSVKDTGAGVPADKLGRLFQRFSQVDSSISRTYGGTGLGLAISKQLVELMSGEIGVNSEAGQGSEFWFEAPLAYAEAEDAEMEAATDAPIDARVLVVDDVAMNRDIARLMLTAAGCTVVEASSGPEAIALLADQTFDVVLMDLQMPDMDGLAATLEIRKLAAPAGLVPILAMTANVLHEQIAVCLANGMNGHLGKPFRRAEILAAVQRYTRAETDARKAAAAKAEPATVIETAPQAAAEPNRTTFDPEMLLALGAVPASPLRRELLSGLLIMLDSALERDHADAANRSRLRTEAHDLVSAAGSLGFVGVSNACRSLQNACDDPAADIEAPLIAARSQAAAAAALLRDLTIDEAGKAA